MAEDYRNTMYCPKLNNIVEKKKKVQGSILSKHSRARDMHTYLSKNDDSFKEQFIEAYNGKCAYCGVSTNIIPIKMFEVDHVIPKNSNRFHSKAEAGFMENLVLSCYYCNRAKGDLECSNEDINKIHPDGDEITKSFIRDSDFYIRISDKMKDDATVTDFYQRIGFGNQLHRLDYLLINMRGLCEKISDKHPAYKDLLCATDLLQQRRNIMG